MIRRGLAALLILLAPAWAGCVTPAFDPRATDQLEGLGPPSCTAPCATPVARTHDTLRYLQEAPLAVNPNDPDHRVIVLYEGTSYISWFHVAVTRDGGQTWTRRPLPGGPLAAPTETLWGVNHLRHPSVAITTNGEVVVSGYAKIMGPVENAGPNGMLFVAHSPDGGETFPIIHAAHRNGGVIVPGTGTWAALRWAAYSWVTAAPDGGLLLAYDAWGGTYRAAGDSPDETRGLFVRRSDDGGRSWSEPEHVEDGRLWHPKTLVGLSGTEYVLVHDPTNAPPMPREDLLPPPRELVLFVREKGATTWERRVVGMTAAYASMAVARVGDAERLFPVNPEYLDPPEKGLIRTVLLRSDDAGSSWSEPLVVQEPEFSGQPYPSVAVDGQDTVFVTLYHPVEDDGTLEYRAYAVRDGRVSEPTLLDEANAHGVTFRFGHYMGLAGLDGGAAAAWLGGDVMDAGTVRYTNEFRLMSATLGGVS